MAETSPASARLGVGLLLPCVLGIPRNKSNGQSSHSKSWNDKHLTGLTFGLDLPGGRTKDNAVTGRVSDPVRRHVDYIPAHGAL